MEISPEKVLLLVQRIKDKKELLGLSDEFVQQQLLLYLRKNPPARKILQENRTSRSAKYKRLVKNIRAQLRKVHGLFEVKEHLQRRKELLEELLVTLPSQQKRVLGQLLRTHSSTKERLSFYTSLYQKMFAMTGKPARILDLGCGLNPFTILYMNLKKIQYYAYDINELEVDLLNEFFIWLYSYNRSCNGKAAIFDLLHGVRVQELEPADICFLFKMTEVLDQGHGHKASEQVITAAPATFVIVSFPTRTMSGKKMNFPRRRWIEWMCTRRGYTFNILEFPTEIFYVIKK